MTTVSSFSDPRTLTNINGAGAILVNPENRTIVGNIRYGEYATAKRVATKLLPKMETAKMLALVNDAVNGGRSDDLGFITEKLSGLEPKVLKARLREIVTGLVMFIESVGGSVSQFWFDEGMMRIARALELVDGEDRPPIIIDPRPEKNELYKLYRSELAKAPQRVIESVGGRPQGTALETAISETLEEFCLVGKDKDKDSGGGERTVFFPEAAVMIERRFKDAKVSVIEESDTNEPIVNFVLELDTNDMKMLTDVGKRLAEIPDRAKRHPVDLETGGMFTAQIDDMPDFSQFGAQISEIARAVDTDQDCCCPEDKTRKKQELGMNFAQKWTQASENHIKFTLVEDGSEHTAALRSYVAFYFEIAMREGHMPTSYSKSFVPLGPDAPFWGDLDTIEEQLKIKYPYHERKDTELVANQTGVTMIKAAQTLLEKRGDIVDAIMALVD